MLRGPQTLRELKTNSHRLFDFGDLDDVQYAVQHLIEREPPLVAALPRQAGKQVACPLCRNHELSTFRSAAGLQCLVTPF
jgi:uncharacterized protein YceH (UPF0502 family)